MDEASWSTRVAIELRREVAESRRILVVPIDVRTPDAETVEVRFAWPEPPLRRGIWLTRAEVADGPEMLRDLEAEEIAFWLIWTGSDEPHPPECFDPPDAEGVAWFPGRRWMFDVAAEVPPEDRPPPPAWRVRLDEVRRRLRLR